MKKPSINPTNILLGALAAASCTDVDDAMRHHPDYNQWVVTQDHTGRESFGYTDNNEVNKALQAMYDRFAHMASKHGMSVPGNRSAFIDIADERDRLLDGSGCNIGRLAWRVTQIPAIHQGVDGPVAKIRESIKRPIDCDTARVTKSGK